MIIPLFGSIPSVSIFFLQASVCYLVLLFSFLQYFGDDNEKQYIYKEPKVTSLTELTHRLQRLYTRKFGPDIVQIIMESGKVCTLH